MYKETYEGKSLMERTDIRVVDRGLAKRWDNGVYFPVEEIQVSWLADEPETRETAYGPEAGETAYEPQADFEGPEWLKDEPEEKTPETREMPQRQKGPLTRALLNIAEKVDEIVKAEKAERKGLKTRTA